MKYNKEKFEDFEKVRESGETNMFDINMVSNLSDNLIPEEIKDIMSNYDDYKDRFDKGE